MKDSYLPELGLTPPQEFKSRSTNHGLHIEDDLADVLVRRQWAVQRQVDGGVREDGTRIRLDLVITRHDRKTIVVSVKSQNVNGTGEDKMPYEVLTLAQVLAARPEYHEAIIVCKGKKFREKKLAYWKRGGLSARLAGAYPTAARVSIITFEDFYELVSTDKL